MKNKTWISKDGKTISNAPLKWGDEVNVMKNKPSEIDKKDWEKEIDKFWGKTNPSGKLWIKDLILRSIAEVKELGRKEFWNEEYSRKKAALCKTADMNFELGKEQGRKEERERIIKEVKKIPTERNQIDPDDLVLMDKIFGVQSVCADFDGIRRTKNHIIKIIEDKK